jgi:pimeloyl-ACP methyl ester carboxylesterase
VTRPRILLVPGITELEWRIKPLLEEWADVASFDAPGVGEEPPPSSYEAEAIVERGLEEISRRGWDSAVVAGDEVGTAIAVRLASGNPERVDALVLGHACLNFRRRGERPAVGEDISAALTQIVQTDFRAYARALTQVTQSAYDDEMAEEFMRRVPQDAARQYLVNVLARDEHHDMEDELKSIEAPLLLAQHKGCLMWTAEGFEDCAKALPQARTSSFEIKPSASPEFAETLREFCEDVVTSPQPAL